MANQFKIGQRVQIKLTAKADTSIERKMLGKSGVILYIWNSLRIVEVITDDGLRGPWYFDDIILLEKREIKVYGIVRFYKSMKKRKNKCVK